MSLPIPEPFKRLRLRPNPFIDGCGPLYGRRDGENFVLALRVEVRHCNPAGNCHGGMLSTLADMLLILGSTAQCASMRFMTTVSLSCDFVAPAPLHSWLEGRVQVLREARSLVFSQGVIGIDGAPVARVSGILKPTGDADPASSLSGYLGEGAG
jgi:uncharacterized protein (TIGR00369 family)